MTYLKAVIRENIIYSLFSNGTACVGDTLSSKTPSAVDSCDSIKDLDIVIPPSIEENGKSYTIISLSSFSFYKCRQSRITLPDTLKFIHRNAIDLCRMETELKLPESLEVIDQWGIASNNFQSITIPKRVRYLGNGFASFCPIISISVDSQNPFYKLNYDGVLYNIGFTTLLLAPQNLTEIKIPDTVVEIYTAALAGLKFTEIIIPKSVKKLHAPLIYSSNIFKNLYILGNVEFPERNQAISEATIIENFIYMGTRQITYDIFQSKIPKNITVCHGYNGNSVGTVQTFNINEYCASYPIERLCFTLLYHNRFHISYFLYQMTLSKPKWNENYVP